MAAQEGHHQVVEILLKNGANVNDSREVFEFILFKTTKTQQQLNILSFLFVLSFPFFKNGGTPLHAAVFNQHEKIVEILLNNGAKICDSMMVFFLSMTKKTRIHNNKINESYFLFFLSLSLSFVRESLLKGEIKRLLNC